MEDPKSAGLEGGGSRPLALIRASGGIIFRSAVTEGDVVNTIKFLGTAGARYVVAKQLRASGGILLDLEGERILIDPGPGCMVHLASSRPRIDPTEIDTIILTHKHIDHSSDVNALIDGMTAGGIQKKGTLIAPGDALEGDPVVLRYLRDYLKEIIVTREGLVLERESLTIEAPLRVRHSVETYGFLFHTTSGTLSHIPDTSYFPELATAFRADLTIINVVLAKNRGGIDHLDINDARMILAEMRPKVGIITHFGMSLLKMKPWELAREMEKEIGLRVLAARDGMNVNLDEVLCSEPEKRV
jgi:ribonuclease BN (tRNA processing enzyme)